MKNIGRLLRTIAYLRPGQIAYQITNRLPSFVPLRSGKLIRRSSPPLWSRFVRHPQTMLAPDRFRFLSIEGDLTDAGAWDDPARSRLWTYNLHYFDDLLSEGADARANWHADLISRWIVENPPLNGPGWEPYTLSRRVVNWIISDLAGSKLSAAATESLALQGRALRRMLEYHLRGNHLFVNAKALIFLGAFFQGDEAEEWIKTGLSILTDEVSEQILDDGGHFELSPMYHALLLEDVLDLIQLSDLYPETLSSHRQDWGRTAETMLRWLAIMSHPDGRISFFNDCAFNEARNLAELTRYAEGLGLGPLDAPQHSVLLPHSGFARLCSELWTVIVDVGAVGASYIPGHGHADTLSLELSVGSDRLVTNGGTSTYAPGSVRAEERGTRSHATIEIDGKDSSEVWASFRVGRRANVHDVAFVQEDDKVTATHDGYRYLRGRPTHKRSVQVSGELVIVSDFIGATSSKSVVARFPLHPSVRIVADLENGWLLQSASGMKVEVEVVGGVSKSVESGYFAPEFGKREERPVLCWRASSSPTLSVATQFRMVNS